MFSAPFFFSSIPKNQKKKEEEEEVEVGFLKVEKKLSEGVREVSKKFRWNKS